MLHSTPSTLQSLPWTATVFTREMKPTWNSLQWIGALSLSPLLAEGRCHRRPWRRIPLTPSSGTPQRRRPPGRSSSSPRCRPPRRLPPRTPSSPICSGVLAVKAAYAQLQLAQFPYDAEAI
ncbi:hypothetical protein VPH35_129496 [Triticum aestivum]